MEHNKGMVSSMPVVLRQTVKACRTIRLRVEMIQRRAGGESGEHCPQHRGTAEAPSHLQNAPVALDVCQPILLVFRLFLSIFRHLIAVVGKVEVAVAPVAGDPRLASLALGLRSEQLSTITVVALRVSQTRGVLAPCSGVCPRHCLA